MLHPRQFQVNEAWIAFQLNSLPVYTVRDGSFNSVALMDAASCYIFGMVLVPVDDPEPSRSEVRRLLKMGWAHKRRYPALLFLPAGRFPVLLAAEAERLGITVVPVQESQLLVFIGEAREGFKERFESGRASREV
jgi:hypothetical protein